MIRPLPNGCRPPGPSEGSQRPDPLEHPGAVGRSGHAPQGPGLRRPLPLLLPLRPLLFGALCLFGLRSPALADSQYDSVYRGQLEYTLKDCKTYIEEQRFDACTSALKSLAPQLPASDRESHRVIEQRIRIVEAHKRAGSLRVEKPAESARILFSAYTALPERYFPYEEVLPLWNLYIRDEAGRNRFNRYRKVKVLVRAPKGEEELSAAVDRVVQQRLLDYGYLWLEPTTTQQPDVFVKAGLRGQSLEGSSDPRLQYRKGWRLTLEVQSFKWILQDQSVKTPAIVQDAVSMSPEDARQEAIEKGASRLVDVVFYQTLTQMFPPESSGSELSGSGGEPSATPPKGSP